MTLLQSSTVDSTSLSPTPIPWAQDAMIYGQISDYHKVMSTDLDGTFFCARAAGEVWRRQAKEGTDSNGNKLKEQLWKLHCDSLHERSYCQHSPASGCI
jgi:hypothetical protein